MTENVAEARGVVELFDQIDTNGNGELTRTEVPVLGETTLLAV